MLGSGATEEALNRALDAAMGRVDILHLATHGTFDADDALDSGLELAAGGGETSRLTARDIVRRELHVELVVLSACESGRTAVLAGDEPVGLTRAFLSAGAAAVLSTLWLTNDLSTRLIIERFYDDLLRKLDGPVPRWRKAESLRRASLAVRTITMADLIKQPDAGIAAIALELAAERNLSEGERPFDAPRFWAPFTLIGAWS
jgi:CHAT domain-containing protein